MSAGGAAAGGEPRGGARPRSADQRSDAAEPPVLPDRAADDADTGWGDRVEDDDDRWQAERPPHWE